MLTAADLLHLPYTPDLTEAGIAYACRSLALARAGRPQPTFRSLRRTVANVAAELSFRRHLQAESVRFKVLGAAPFTEPDRYEVSIHGCRCELVSYFISHRSQVNTLHADPAHLLLAPALLASDEFAAEHHHSDDLYLFAFVLGLEENPSPKRPACLIQVLPPAWSRPSQPLALNTVTLKSEAQAPIQVELGGLNSQREFVSARMQLEPGKNAPVEPCFSSLAYIRTAGPMQARLALSVPGSGKMHVIAPYGWGNLWFEGLDIVLSGWLSHEEFRRRAAFVNAGSRTLQFDRTAVKNLAVPLSGLKPFWELLSQK